MLDFPRYVFERPMFLLDTKKKKLWQQINISPSDPYIHELILIGEKKPHKILHSKQFGDLYFVLQSWVRNKQKYIHEQGDDGNKIFTHARMTQDLFFSKETVRLMCIQCKRRLTGKYKFYKRPKAESYNYEL